MERERDGWVGPREDMRCADGGRGARAAKLEGWCNAVKLARVLQFKGVQGTPALGSSAGREEEDRGGGKVEYRG